MNPQERSLAFDAAANCSTKVRWEDLEEFSNLCRNKEAQVQGILKLKMVINED